MGMILMFRLRGEACLKPGGKMLLSTTKYWTPGFSLGLSIILLCIFLGSLWVGGWQKKYQCSVAFLAGLSSRLIVGPKISQEFLPVWVYFVGKPTRVLKHIKNHSSRLFWDHNSIYFGAEAKQWFSFYFYILLIFFFHTSNCGKMQWNLQYFFHIKVNPKSFNAVIFPLSI